MKGVTTMAKHRTKRQTQRRTARTVKPKLKVVKALPKVPVAVALPKDHVAVLAVSAEGVHVLPVPKKVIEKTGWEKFLNWAGFDVG
jgi:hypothetical protein